MFEKKKKKKKFYIFCKYFIFVFFFILAEKKMQLSQFSNFRTTGFDQGSPVRPVSECRGGIKSVTADRQKMEILVSNIGQSLSIQNSQRDLVGRITTEYKQEDLFYNPIRLGRGKYTMWYIFSSFLMVWHILGIFAIKIGSFR